MARVDLNSIPAHRIKQAVASTEALERYNPPKIREATEKIAQLSGYSCYADMARRFNNIHDLLGRAAADPRMGATTAQYAQFVLADPDNYNFDSMSCFHGIDITMQVLLAGRNDLTGAQLGCSYGPYLLYLQEERGLRGFVGIDNDPIAIKYAESIGVKVLLHDARKLPFADASQDVIFTSHFLDPMYCSLVDSANGVDPQKSSPVFFREVMREVHRVLRPGGIHIMDNEYPYYYPEVPWLLAPFAGAHFYPKEFSAYTLDYVAVLQKED